MAAILLVQRRIEMPEPPPILEDDRVQRTAVELTARPSVTAPVNPLRGDTARVELPVKPLFTATVVGLAVML